MTAAADFGAGVESTLGFADGELIADLRDRVVTALRYTLSWNEAVKGSAFGLGPIDIAAGNAQPIDALGFLARISDMQTTLRGLLDMMPLSDTFPGNDDVAAYNAASADFAQLYRDLALSRTTLPKPDLLERLADLGSGVFNAPAAAATTVAETIANALAKALGGTAGAIWSALWPWLLVGGAVGLVYVFRAPLGRALGKVAA